MRKQAELLLLSVMLFSTALHAAPTEKEKALASGNLLASANVWLMGAVLNKRTFPIPEALYRKL